MELTTGLKQTEIGPLPSDWDVVALGQLVRITSGDSPSRFLFQPTGTPYYKVEQLSATNKYLYRSSTPYFFDGNTTVPARSVVFAKRGAAIALNKVRILTEPSFMDTNLMALTPGDRLDAEYLYYALAHIGLWRLADTTSVPQINNKHINPLRFPLPTLAEQQAIAGALGDVDTLLERLDRLISKKRDLKQASAQQILTGRTRLPGFHGEWKSATVNELADVDPEQLESSTPPSLEFNYVSLENVDRGTLRGFAKHTFRSSPSRARRVLRHNDVIAATVRPNLQSHLWFRGEKGRWVCSTGFAVIRCKPGVGAPGFVFHQLFSHHVGQQLDALIAGSNYPAITSDDVRRLELRTPPSVDEQHAIAQVLEDMDAEIAALESRRAKTRDLKLAMMQELLTGKTRFNTTGGSNG